MTYPPECTPHGQRAAIFLNAYVGSLNVYVGSLNAYVGSLRRPSNPANPRPELTQHAGHRPADVPVDRPADVPPA